RPRQLRPGRRPGDENSGRELGTRTSEQPVHAGGQRSCPLAARCAPGVIPAPPPYMHATDLAPLPPFPHELADLARPLARAHFRSLASVDRKHDRTPVTAADRAIERALRQCIGERFPAHGVLGEEEGADRVDAEWLWVLDPIDGT